MEWYEVLLIIGGFAVILAALYYFRKKGYIKHDAFTAIKAGVQFICGLVKKLLGKEQTPAAQIATFIVRLVEAAILTAEALWYDGEIDYDQRHEKAKEILVGILTECGVSLPENTDEAMGILITAAQNAAGHESYDDYAVALVAECDIDEESVQDTEGEP